MPLNLVQLATFRELASEQNFTRVAERLGVTQPAVSQQIRSLQEHFRAKLVDVVGRDVVLTDAGRFLAERSTAILGSVVALEREMREYADIRTGELRVGASMTIGTYALPSYVVEFACAHPDIVLSVVVENTQEIVSALLAGRISLGLVEGIVEEASLELTPYVDDELILIAAPDHEFASARTPLAAQRLDGLAFIYREIGSGTRRQVEIALARANVTPRVVLTLPNGEGIVRAVSLGIGVAIVSRLVAEEPIREGRVVEIPTRGLHLHRTLRIARMRGLTQSPAGAAFEAMLLRKRTRARAKGTR